MTKAPSKALDAVPASRVAAPVPELSEGARMFAEASRSESTRRAYRSDWAHFESWCRERGYPGLPASPAAVANYLESHAGTFKAVTLGRRLVSISQAHKIAGFQSPTDSEAVRSVLKGIKRTHGTASVQKAPAVVDILRRMITAQPDTLLGLRNRALIIVGFAGAFRRSEVVSLDVADLEFTSEGMIATLRRSKTDQEGAGREIGIPFGRRPDTCPVRTLQAWLAAAEIAEGPIFRAVSRHGSVGPDRLSGFAVARIVKRAAEAAGEDPARYGGHSLRAGLATSAAAEGVAEGAIMNQTGHRSVAMVRKYVRHGSLFRQNAAGLVGL